MQTMLLLLSHLKHIIPKNTIFKIAFYGNWENFMNTLRAESKERVQWLDTARCIGIFLVILGHISFGPIFGHSAEKWIYSFHMPLFFFLSGLTQKNLKFAESVKKAARQLLLPYSIFYVLTFLWWLMVSVLRHPEIYPNRFDAILKGLLGLLIANGYDTKISFMANVPLWFCAGLFWCKLVFAIVENSICKKEKNKKIAHVALCALFLVLAFLCKKIGIPDFKEIVFGEKSIRAAIRFLPFSLQTLTLSYPIFFIGVCMKEKIFSNSPSADKKAKRIFIMLLFLLLSVFVVPLNGRIDMNGAYFGNDIFLFLFGAFCGIVFIYELSVLISPLPKFFSFMGKESLTILACHSITTSLAQTFFKNILRCPLKADGANSFSFPIAISLATISFFLCAIPCFVISKHFPWILGRNASPRLSKIK